MLLVVDCVTLFKNIFAFTCTVPPAEFKIKLPDLVSIVLVSSCILPKVETPVASNWLVVVHPLTLIPLAPKV